MKQHLGILATFIAALVLAGCGLSSADIDKLSAACDGKAVAGASAHDGGPKGFVPFKKDNPNGRFEYDVNGVHWKLTRPSKLVEARTVFCMEPPEEVPEGACAFETSKGLGVVGIQIVELGRSKGPTFPRVSVQRKARLVDPSTGKTIAEHTHKSAAPKCSQFVGDPTESSFRALVPSGISFAEWATGQLGVKK